jgi:tetratricopeptide (TPR) repeat protein
MSSMEETAMYRTPRPVVLGIACALALAMAAPALAQKKGTLRGSVVNEAGDPIAQIRVDFVNVDDPNKKQNALTDRNGEFFRNNLEEGLWNLEADKDGLVARYHRVTVKPDEVRRIQPMVLRDPSAPPAVEETAMDSDEIAKRNARMAELKLLFAQAEASTNKGDFDDALAKLTEIAAEIEECAACYARMGDVYRRKGELEAAEKAFKQSIEYDPKAPDAYAALATLYNEQRRFDEANEMSAKASELMGSSGGGGDALTAYNQGVILWNQSKFAEAGEAFDRARKADPKLADAHYRFALALFNQGKLPEAKEPLETYLKLAPTGEHAEAAKSLLAAIK